MIKVLWTNRNKETVKYIVSNLIEICLCVCVCVCVSNGRSIGRSIYLSPGSTCKETILLIKLIAQCLQTVP